MTRQIRVSHDPWSVLDDSLLIGPATHKSPSDVRKVTEIRVRQFGVSDACESLRALA